MIIKNLDLGQLKQSIEADFCENEPLARHNWYKTGGSADLLVYPHNQKSLKKLIALIKREKINFTIIGDGANLLVSDFGFRGIVIKLKRYFNQIKLKDLQLEAGAGALLDEIISFCVNKGLGGLEYLSGIPGTIGGALIMNAGTDNGVISDMLIHVRCIDEDNQFIQIGNKDITFAYRSAPELKDKVILSACFELKKNSVKALKKIRDDRLICRRNNQPLEFPSCGSVFKRPVGHYASKLIDELGLKGYRYKNAMVSKKHAGFIVNLGGATSSDILRVMKEVQKRVYEEVGIKLEPEVKFIGFTAQEIL